MLGYLERATRKPMLRTWHFVEVILCDYNFSPSPGNVKMNRLRCEADHSLPYNI
jgi:hypothetical protein